MNRELYDQFKELQRTGQHQEAKAALGKLIGSFDEFGERAKWALRLLEHYYDGNTIRHELYEQVIFPVLFGTAGRELLSENGERLLPRVIDLFRTADEHQREALGVALSNIGPPAALKLIDLLRDPDEELAESAAYALEEFEGSEEITGALVEAMYRGSPRVAIAAANATLPCTLEVAGGRLEALATQREHASGRDWDVFDGLQQDLCTLAHRGQDLLLDAATSPRWSVRTIALELLATNNDGRAGEMLVVALDDPSPDVRTRAIELVWPGRELQLDISHAARWLCGALIREAWWVFKHALLGAVAFAMIGVVICWAMDNWGPLKALIGIGLVLWPLLLIAGRVLLWIAEIGDDSGRVGVPFRLKRVCIGKLTQHLDDSEPKVRAAAARKIAEVKGRGAVPLLFPLRTDPSPEVRGRVAVALGTVGEYPLLLVALHDSEPAVRVEAVAALGRHYRKQGTRKLSPIRTLTEDLPSLDETVLPALGEATRDRHAAVRAAAIRALGEIEARISVPHFLLAIEDPEDSVKRVALEALQAFPESVEYDRAIKFLSSGDIEMCMAVRKLISAKTHHDGTKMRNWEAVPKLIALLKVADSQVRYDAIQALRSIGDASAGPAIVESLRDTDAGIWGVDVADSTSARHQAVLALEEFGDLSVVPILIELQNDPILSIRRESARVLGVLRAKGTARRGFLARLFSR